MRFGLALGRPAKAAVATREAGGNQCGELLALLVLEHRLVADHRTLVLALVEDVEHAGIGGDVGGRCQPLVVGVGPPPPPPPYPVVIPPPPTPPPTPPPPKNHPPL